MENETNEMEAKQNEESNSILTPKEYLKGLLSKAEIEVVEDTGVMRAILDEGKRVQKMAAKYGTSQDIGGEEAFNGFGTYVVSVNEENARQLGIKIASKRYGGSFYINGQPFNEFLKEKNFSPYWESRLEQFKDYNVEYLADDFLRADVKGNPALEKERDTLSTLFSLGLVEYKREQAFLYSVDIPDNDSTNYLLYGNPIGIENANRINERLERMNVEWRVTRNDIGKNVYFNTLSEKVFGGSQESASKFLKEAGYVGMEMNSANYIVFDDKDMKVTNRVQYMIDGDSNVYGFAYDGKIYADPEIATSNTYAHEYTHLWDAYTQRTNPELWERGKDIFKGTSLWNEVMTDENYQNLSNDDEILSECHSRIVGRMAEKVLERIAEKNGGILRDQVIDWDNEVAEYVAGELGAELSKPELESENYISDSARLEIAREFLSQPMKDLMEGRKIGVEMEKSELYKENEAELKFIVEEMMEETLPGLSKMAEPVENEKDPAASTSTQLSGATSAQGLLDAQDTATAISTHIRHKDNIVEIKNQEHFIEKFNAFAGEIANSDTPMPPKEFLDKIKKTFDMNVAAETTGYAFTRENNETFKIRISDHKAVLRNRLGARTELTSLVIQLNDSRRRDSDKAKLSEFVYFPESLDKETQVGIINGINDWILGHEYTDKHYDQMYVSTARALQERLKESEQTVSKMAKSAETEILEPTAREWAKDIEAKLNFGMEQSISEILAESEATGVKENAKEIASEICASILSVYKEIAKYGDTEYFKGGERQMSNRFAGLCTQKVLETHGVFLPKYPDESGETEKVISTVMQVSDEIHDFIKTNTYENFHGGQSLDSEVEHHETKALSSEDIEPPPAEENVVVTRKTVKASEIFKEFEEGMIFSGISHKDFDSAMLDYLHQRSGREEAENGSFDTQDLMFDFLVAQKIHDARARTFVLDKIERYKGMTVEFDADNIDLGYLRLSDRDGAKEVEKELEELKAAHPILVKNLSGQNENEETVKAENPFLSADTEQVQELYEQAEAVEKMQQEAASSVEFDGNGKPYYPKNEAEEEPLQDKFRRENEVEFQKLDAYLETGEAPKNNEFLFGGIPDILKYAAVPDHEVVLTTGIIAKARKVHQLSDEAIRNAITSLADPVAVFDSDRNRTENKSTSIIAITDVESSNGRPVALSLNLDAQRKGFEQQYIVNEIRSIHDRTLIAKNGVNITEEWADAGLLRYADDKKISRIGKEREDSFLLPLTKLDIESIPTKSDFVKQLDERAGKKMPETSSGKEAASALVESSAENEENMPKEKNVEVKGVDGKISEIKIEFGKTTIAKFAMVTQNGLKSYSDMAVASYEKTTDSYLLVSGDKSQQVRVQSSTMTALLSDERQKEIEKTNSQIEENKKTGRGTESLEFKKERLEQGMSVAQYNDFFQTRENCANNFRHNLSVMCRREANSPLDALKVANKIITQMSDAEKLKTRDLLDLLRKGGQSRNEVLVDVYNEAVKATPLNEQYLLNQRYDKMIARPMYDTVSDRGEKIDGNFNLRVGDTLKMTFNVDKDIAFGGTKLERKRPAFGNKEVMFSECKIISSSKEGNVVTLMDGNKSFYDVPRDTFLKEYAKREKYEKKQEIKEAHKKNIMRLDIER